MPQQEPRLTVRAALPIVSGLRNLGWDPAPILAEVGLNAEMLEDPDGQFTMSLGVALLNRAVETTGDRDLGLHLAERTDLGSLDVHFYAMLSSPTLGAAFERLCRFQRLIHETTRVTLELKDERATLRHQMPGGLAVPRQSAEFIVAAWLRGGRVITGQEWDPIEVRFAHPRPEDIREHERFFRAPVHFSAGENSLVFHGSLLEMPCVGADPALLAVLDRYAADRLRRTPDVTGIADRARAALAEELHGGEPSARQLASRLKMSVRTMNRALAAEGTSYRELLDQLRQELSLRLLRDNRLAIPEVAFHTGFSELSAFYRAFKRWTRQTPAEFRSLHRP